MLSNQAIAQMLNQIADAMEVMGENRFRLAAYRRAAETVAGLSVSLETARQQAPLSDLPNIGEALAGLIGELLDTGHTQLYDEMMARVPPGLLDLLRVPEVGPKSAARLFHEFGITDLAALRAAASEGRLRSIKGFGAKTEARILAGIEALDQREERIRLVDALPVMDELVAALGGRPEVARLAPVGSLRRGRSTVGDLNLLAAGPDGAAIVAAFVGLPQVAAVERQTAAAATVQLHNGMRATLQVADPAAWGAALLLATGAEAHLAQLAALAASRQLAITAQGMERSGAPLACATEDLVYAALDLPWLAPELREGWGEIEQAQSGQLPILVEQRDLRCDLHWHTSWSDGRSSLREMVSAGQALGYSHMAVADHSAYLGVTGGLDAERLREQRREIDALNAEIAAGGSDFRLLQCCEVDILPDGSLALADDVLAGLDLVIASPHVALRLPRAEATARLVRAIQNPRVHIIGHPTGRLLNQRAGADLDMDAVLDAAAAAGVALEVNAGPERLDLDAPHIRQALRRGIKLTINTDAHDPRHLAGISLGVTTARRGGATAAAVINTWPLEQLQSWIRTKGA